MKEDEWEVNLISSEHHPHWELSVVRKEFTHGHKSWGWHGGKKIYGHGKVMICAYDAECPKEIQDEILKLQMKVAEDICNKLNNGELNYD